MKKVTKIDTDKVHSDNIELLRVAAYCRVSSDSEEQLESLEAQKQHYESYISRRADWKLAGLYFDEGISGTKKEKRSALLQMLSDCEAGKIDLVITKSISRFARNTADCLEMVRKLLEHDIPVYFEKEDINTKSMESELFLAVMSSMAEGESKSISENNKWSIQKRFRNGTYKLSSAPYGYDWDGEKLIINKEQVPHVQWLFEQAAAGKGTYVIAKALNERGIPTRKGGRWSSSTIRTMIRNEKYVGDVILQKTYTDAGYKRHINYGQQDKYSIEDDHEAIVSREVFNAANDLVRRHCLEKGIEAGGEKYRARYCFSGLIECGECGGRFKRRTHSLAGEKYIAWCCNTHIINKEQCSMKFIRDDELKSAFVTMMNRLICERDKILKPYIAVLRKESKDYSLRRLQELQALLLKNTEQRDTLMRLMSQGYIDQPLFNKENSALLYQADKYRIEIERLNKAATGDVSQLTAARELLHYTELGIMIDEFDEELFKKTVDTIRVISRKEIAFELKCGLTRTESM